MTLMMMTMMEMLTIMVVIPMMFLWDGVQQICHQPPPTQTTPPRVQKNTSLSVFLNSWTLPLPSVHHYIIIWFGGCRPREGRDWKGICHCHLGSTHHPPPSSNNILVGKIQKYVKKVSKMVFFDIWGSPTTIIETPTKYHHLQTKISWIRNIPDIVGAYILKASTAALNFPQIFPKMPRNGPKMAKNYPKYPKVAQIWPQMAQNDPTWP